jgi:hypothetical protein
MSRDVHSCTHWLIKFFFWHILSFFDFFYYLVVRPQPPPPPPQSNRIGIRNTRALLVSKDRRHLFVTPWPTPNPSAHQQHSSSYHGQKNTCHSHHFQYPFSVKGLDSGHFISLEYTQDQTGGRSAYWPGGQAARWPGGQAVRRPGGRSVRRPGGKTAGQSVDQAARYTDKKRKIFPYKEIQRDRVQIHI